ncbi:MAG: PHA/PHB synthase family protein [Burkholderiales bacterium]
MSSSAASPDQALQEITSANAALLEKFLRDLPSGNADMTALLRAFTHADNGQLAKLQALQTALYHGHLSLWHQLATPGNNGASFAGKSVDPSDAPEWQLPFFQYLQQAYVLNAQFLTEVGELAHLEPHAKRRLQFQLRQLIDAMSPKNTAATNPEVIKLAAQTGGGSLAQGMKLLAGDIGRGRISMTDEQAFEVGRNLAITPGAVVYENEVMQLIQYAPATQETYEYPLLIVPPFINKYYILDLQPDNSFVRFCVEQGLNTFIISWRNVTPDLGQFSWSDYVEKGVLAPVDVVKIISGATHISTLGFCVGGTLLSCALAVMAAKKQNEVGSLTLLATMLDFSDTGDISVYIDREYVERSEREFGASGCMSGSKLASTFATLRANDLIWHFVVNSYLKGNLPRAFDLLYWNADGSNLPGRLYTYYLRNMYLENNLKIPGRLIASGVPIDLRAIDMPAYIVATKEDHIVPWRTAYASVKLLGGSPEFVLGASGHVAGIVNPPSKNRRHYWLNPSADVDPDAWLSGATQKAGSWWTHWGKWISSRSGALRAAPATLGSTQFPKLESAPGRYVKEKSV